MISLCDALPLIQLGQGGAVALEHAWLAQCLEQAASAAGYENWPASDVARSVTDFLRVNEATQPYTMEHFTSAVNRVLRGIGYGEVAPYFLRSGLELRFSLFELVREVPPGFLLGFFKACEVACQKLLSSGLASRIVFEDLHPAVKLMLGRSHWSPYCQTVADELVDFLRASVLKAAGSGNVAFLIR
ncbi:MAG: hypothetical protein WCL08_04160 [Verrucomicrobiota bacterium]